MQPPGSAAPRSAAPRKRGSVWGPPRGPRPTAIPACLSPPPRRSCCRNRPHGPTGVFQHARKMTDVSRWFHSGTKELGVESLCPQSFLKGHRDSRPLGVGRTGRLSWHLCHLLNHL